jgi:hypothetical protein
MDYYWLTSALIGFGITVASVAMVAIALGFVKVVIGWFRVKLGADQYAFLKEVAKTTVRYIEQSAKWDKALNDGSVKKGTALLMLSQTAKDLGIPVAPDMLDRVIEEAVNIMKADVGEAQQTPAQTESRTGWAAVGE